jgi:hypothetical protein
MIIITESNGEQYLIEAFNREQLLDMLRKDTVVVSFRKRTNDRQRLMYCTRDLKRIPRNKHPSGVGMPYDPVEKGLIPVFDLIKKDWRSFAIDNVTDAQARTLGWLTRFLQRKKYTMDESVEFPGAVIVEAYHIDAKPERFRTFLEMASGPVGDGGVKHVTPEVFAARRNRWIQRTSNYTPIEHWGNVGSYKCFAQKSESFVNFWATTASDPQKSLDNPESIIFYVTMFQDGHWPLKETLYGADLPLIDPALAGKGLGTLFYALMAEHISIIASNIQTKQARLLWASLVKSNRCKVYMYNEYTEELDDISGALETFKHYMAEADPEIRFIATTKDLA